MFSRIGKVGAILAEEVCFPASIASEDGATSLYEVVLPAVKMLLAYKIWHLGLVDIQPPLQGTKVKSI